jgi:hypothetical protein
MIRTGIRTVTEVFEVAFVPEASDTVRLTEYDPVVPHDREA